jgi:biopolymer transport protein ExbB/TolQ
MIFNHWFEGGPLFMTFIYLMWLAVIILVATFWLKKGKTERRPLVKLNEAILFTGSLAFLTGILGQVVGIFQALTVLETITDISPKLIAAGLRVSFLAPLYGFMLLIISVIIWFIHRSLIDKTIA